MKRIASFFALFSAGLACYGQDAEKDVDDHQAERQEWFYSQREFPLGHIPTRARLNAIDAIKNMERSSRQTRVAVPAASPRADASPWSLIGPRPTAGASPTVPAGAFHPA